MEDVKHKAEDVKHKVEDVIKPITDQIDEKDKVVLKDHLRGAIVDSIKKPLKFMNTTGEIVNSKEAEVVVKLFGG